MSRRLRPSAVGCGKGEPRPITGAGGAAEGRRARLNTNVVVSAVISTPPRVTTPSKAGDRRGPLPGGRQCSTFVAPLVAGQCGRKASQLVRRGLQRAKVPGSRYGLKRIWVQVTPCYLASHRADKSALV
jgi:hypothetical protein